MKTVSYFVAAAMLVVWGCGGVSPVQPDSTLLPTATPTLTGQVHEFVTWGDPPLSDAVIEVTGADGSKKTGISDDDGFYRIAAAAGTVIVTASKPGFQTKTSQFMLVSDTVLNFSLSPE